MVFERFVSLIVLAAGLTLFQGSALAKAKPDVPSPPSAAEVAYGPVPSWVISPPQSTSTPAAVNAPYRVDHFDMQVHRTPQGVERYTDLKITILSAQALSIGRLSAQWSPSSGTAMIHAVKILRDGQEIDVLQNSHFTVIQREENLEASMLTGNLTAMLQVPGLRVGDTLIYTATTRSNDVVFGDHAYGIEAMILSEGPGAFRLRLDWPSGRPLHWQVSPDLKDASKVDAKGNGVTMELRDPNAIKLTTGAPPRLGVRRIVEYSDFAAWKDLSAAWYALFDHAARLDAQSPLRAEIARIAAASSDAKLRTGEALALVQGKLRYVYVGLEGGNFRPVNADLAWQNRFGDCKAKSAMLLGILRELGIDAEVIAVSSGGGDGLADRLASPVVFDHVLVRVSIGGKSYMIDGTENSNGNLDLVDAPAYRFVLPLRPEGADLERQNVAPPRRPQLIQTLEVDAQGGIVGNLPMVAHDYLIGASGIASYAALAALTPEQADRALRQYWAGQRGWITPDSVSWTWDAPRMTIKLDLHGKGAFDDAEGSPGSRNFNIPSAGFYPPPERKRAKEEDQAAPWLLDFPTYNCRVTNVNLPKSPAKHGWDYISHRMERQLGGIHYFRRGDLRDGILRTVMARKTYLTELSAAEVARVNARISGFDNAISRAFERGVVGNLGVPRRDDTLLPVIGDVDWAALITPCSVQELPGSGPEE